jgi:hypothetical protein
MRPQSLFAAFAALLFSFLSFAGGALADPPSIAPRLAYVSGEVSFSPAGDNHWTQARINRPLTIGDRLWADSGARAEIQLGGAVIRMRESTSLEIMNLTDRLVQVRVDEGSVTLRVRRIEAGFTIEVATPNLAFTARQVGRYRIDVDGSANTTEVVVRNGRGEVYGERASYRLESRQAYRFGGTGLRSYEVIPTPIESDYERWAMERDRRYEVSVSARYVSPYVVGFEELDAHGSWVVDRSYGRVWVPSRVSADWSPYSEGHWAWVEPWGWTWVDDQPWGYAVSHYGRWAHVGNRWAWVPAPVRTRPVYAPALVAFIGGAGFSLTLSTGSDRGIGWFPLGPREIYRPPYRTSQAYFVNVNRTNTVVNNTTIVNVYNSRTVTNTYVNQRVRNAVVATSATDFAESRQVRRAALREERQAQAAQVNAGAGVAPGQQAVRGGQPTAKAEPPARVRERERRVVARNEPPRARGRFEADERDAAAKAQVSAQAAKPAATVETKAIVVTPQAKAPASAPPAKAAEGAPAKGAESKGDERKAGQMAEERKGGQRADERKADEAKAKAAEGKADERKMGQRADERKADEAKAKAAEGKADERKMGQRADERKMGQRGDERKADEAKAKAAESKADERKMGQRADERKAEDRKPPAVATPAVPPVAAPKAAAPVPAPAPAAKQDDRKRDEARERADQAKQQAEQARQQKAEQAKQQAEQARQQKAEQAKQQADQAQQQRAEQAKQQAEQVRQQRADQARRADQEREQRAAQIQQREQAKQQQADQARQQRAEQAKQQAEVARQRAEAKAARIEKAEKKAVEKKAEDDKK